jgi:hypothetical protein
MSVSLAQSARRRAFAREDLVAVEVAAVGQGGDLLAARGLLCLERHGRKLVAVVSLIGHLVGHDQMVLGVDGDLYIVADGGGAFATEMSLHVLAYNMKRVIAIIGVGPLLQAIRA